MTYHGMKVTEYATNERALVSRIGGNRFFSAIVNSHKRIIDREKITKCAMKNERILTYYPNVLRHLESTLDEES